MEETSFFLTSMPSSRPADYYLGYLDGCVFIDFNNYDNNRVYLKRRSFDGYGCCNLEDNATPLSVEDSAAFKALINNGLNNQDLLLTIIKKALALNAKLVWQDALEAYNLT
jgi:hypothetical protein